jgi:hypothetical protein
VIVKQLCESISEPLRVLNGNDDPAVTNDLGQRTGGRYDDGGADRHRLEHREAESLVDRREDQRSCRAFTSAADL